MYRVFLLSSDHLIDSSRLLFSSISLVLTVFFHFYFFSSKSQTTTVKFQK
ncbi:hypothetical protein FM106_24025 [Brachybacterium faecium]|nr:hypothetical protein FM106_24025 [Brachybacterium faecium]